MATERKERVNMLVEARQAAHASAAKRILCGIIQEAGGRFEGQVRLYKAFYYAHLAYWQKYAGYLTSHPMARMPNGPGIDQGDDLLFELQSHGMLKVEAKKRRGVKNPEFVFSLKAGITVNMTEEEQSAIAAGLKKVEGRSGSHVSRRTHVTSRSWQRKRNGQLLNIYEDLLSDEEFEAAKEANQAAHDLLASVFD